jgi:hypothetical protein
MNFLEKKHLPLFGGSINFIGFKLLALQAYSWNLSENLNQIDNSTITS